MLKKKSTGSQIFGREMLIVLLGVVSNATASILGCN
jgi:hypothetical protein